MNDKSNFIYFPSFSVGSFSQDLKDDYKLRNDLSIRFYSKQFPEKWRHPYFLVTAGHYYKKKNFIDIWGINKEDTLILGDSGGFQIASGAIKWDKQLLGVIFDWLEYNSSIAMNLDIPPKMQYAGKFTECLELSKENFKYFAEKQTGATKFLNVLQGVDDLSYAKWYSEVSSFEFSGWAIGGGSSIYRMMAALSVLLKNKEHKNPRNEYLHILGTSKVLDFFVLSQIQKALNDVGSNMRVTTDSSTPSRAVVYGFYYSDVFLKHNAFQYIHLPKERTVQGSIRELDLQYTGKRDNFVLPKCCEFDNMLTDAYIYEDVVNFTYAAYNSIVLHNLYFFKDAMERINSYVYGIDYILQQVVTKDMYLIIKSIREMVESSENGSDPVLIFHKYKDVYKKLGNSDNRIEIEQDFF